MKFQTKIWLGTSAVIVLIMGLDMFSGYRNVENETRRRLEEEARVVRAMLMATRRVYHEQFIASDLPLTPKTVGFLPAHALPRISAEFPNWTTSELRFNNVSDRARNPTNQADADELAAMAWFRDNPKVADHVGTIRDSRGVEFVHFTAPIWVEEYCLKCHGERETAPPTIRDAYANSYGYQAGELRGVMSIRLPLAEIRERALTGYRQRLQMRAAGYVVLLVLIGALMRRLVTRRLLKMELTAQQLASGDLTARVDSSGNDELSALSVSFNNMADAIAKHDAEVTRLNQIYAALSETNQAIVRIEDENELLQRICQVAVDHGGLKMAWIGKPDAANQYFDVAACYGSGQSFVHNAGVPLHGDSAKSQGPTPIAWRTGQPVIVQDYLTDPLTAPWHEQARPFGWGACAAFPIFRGGRVQRTLTLYHAEPHAFDVQMIALLSEMAVDIGYALDRIDLVYEQLRMNVAMRESEEKYRSVVATTLDGFFITDKEGRLLEVNVGYERFSGFSHDELLNMCIADFDADHSSEQIRQHLEKLTIIGSAIFETHHRTKSGDIRPVEVSVSFMPDSGQQYSVFIRDLFKRQQDEARIQQLSHYDTLTGLPNRTLFADRFGQSCGRAQRKGEPLALVFLDLDHFKNINDTLGHRIGDLLLIEITNRLQEALRAEDTISRQGGDEFILLLPNANAESVAHVAEKLLNIIAQPVQVEAHEMVVTASMGIALYPTDGKDFDTLLRKADTAANWAKQETRHTFRFFAAEMQAHSARLLELETALRKALERDELILYYQPQVSLANGAVVGVEALIRWRHPTQGLISPAEFIPIAESTGLILPIGEWVLRTALSQMKEWHDAGIAPPQVAVNLSAVQFRQASLPLTIKAALIESGVAAEALELELTESVTMSNPAEAIAMMDALHSKGIRISIDDFGTGYSSLSYLKRFQIDKLKIDQSFVRDITSDPEDEAIVNAVIRLADSLKFTTIAEGVETEEQLEFLRNSGCQEVQGFLFSRPLPAPELAEWLRNWKSNQLKLF